MSQAPVQVSVGAPVSALTYVPDSHDPLHIHALRREVLYGTAAGAAGAAAAGCGGRAPGLPRPRARQARYCQSLLAQLAPPLTMPKQQQIELLWQRGTVWRGRVVTTGGDWSSTTEPLWHAWCVYRSPILKSSVLSGIHLTVLVSTDIIAGSLSVRTTQIVRAPSASVSLPLLLLCFLGRRHRCHLLVHRLHEGRHQRHRGGPRGRARGAVGAGRAGRPAGLRVPGEAARVHPVRGRRVHHLPHLSGQ